MTPSIDELLDEAEEVSGGQDFPEFWDPQEPGDQLQGRVVEMREDPWADSPDAVRGHIYHIETPSGEVVATRLHSILIRLMEARDVGIGDAVRITFDGTVQTEQANNAKNYTLKHVPASVAEGAGGGDGQSVEAQAAEAIAEEIEPEDSGFDDEVVEFAENITEFHGDDLTRDEFDKYVNQVREFGVDVDELIEHLGLEVTEDGQVVEA